MSTEKFKTKVYVETLILKTKIELESYYKKTWLG